MREALTRYGRHNIGFLWLFVEPMIFTIGITALWTATRTFHGSSLPIAAFALTGYSSVLLWRNMPARCVKAIEPNSSLLYHRNVRLIDIYLSRILLEGAGATISFIVLGVTFWALDWISPPENIMKILEAWIMLAWFGMGLAIFMGSLSERHEIIDKIWHPLQYLLFPLSGAAFLVDALPQSVQSFILYFPMVNGVEMLREGYFGSKIVAHYDIGYMLIFCIILTLLGLIGVRGLRNSVIPQ